MIMEQLNNMNENPMSPNTRSTSGLINRMQRSSSFEKNNPGNIMNNKIASPQQ